MQGNHALPRWGGHPVAGPRGLCGQQPNASIPFPSCAALASTTTKILLPRRGVRGGEGLVAVHFECGAVFSAFCFGLFAIRACWPGSAEPPRSCCPVLLEQHKVPPSGVGLVCAVWQRTPPLPHPWQTERARGKGRGGGRSAAQPNGATLVAQVGETWNLQRPTPHTQQRGSEIREVGGGRERGAVCIPVIRKLSYAH